MTPRGPSRDEQAKTARLFAPPDKAEPELRPSLRRPGKVPASQRRGLVSPDIPQREVRRLADTLRQRGVDFSAVAVRWAGTPALPSLDELTDGGPLFDAEPAADASERLQRAGARDDVPQQ